MPTLQVLLMTTSLQYEQVETPYAQAAARETQPPRAADHGHPLSARAGVGRRGAGGPARAAQLFGGARDASHPGGEGTPEAQAAGRPVHLPADGAPRPGPALGLATSAADL